MDTNGMSRRANVASTNGTSISTLPHRYSRIPSTGNDPQNKTTASRDLKPSVRWRESSSSSFGHLEEPVVASSPHGRHLGRKDMGIVKRSKADVREHRGHVNWEKLRATTEADIQRHIEEDGGATADFGPGG